MISIIMIDFGSPLTYSSIAGSLLYCRRSRSCLAAAETARRSLPLGMFTAWQLEHSGDQRNGGYPTTLPPTLLETSL